MSLYWNYKIYVIFVENILVSRGEISPKMSKNVENEQDEKQCKAPSVRIIFMETIPGALPGFGDPSKNSSLGGVTP